MKKIRVFSFDITMNWLAIAASLLCGTILGLTIITGKTKTLDFLLLPVFVLAFRTFSERVKFWLLSLSIPLSLVQIPSLPLPYGTSVSEAILVVLTLDEILFPHRDQTLNIKPLNPALVVLLCLFSFAGLIANLSGGDIYAWNAYCLTPLIAFFLISRKIHDREDAWLLVKLSLLTIVGFLIIVEWAMATGHFEIYDPLQTEIASGFRMANGMKIILGPISFITFATRLGAIAALGFPTCVLLWIVNKGKLWWKMVLLLIMAGFGYVLILSATRGSVVAAILGSLLVILISGRFRSPIFLGALALSLIVLTLWGGTILNLLPAQNIQRLQTLLQGVQTNENYLQRMKVLALAWNLTLKNPLGVGFGYLFHTYRIDDAIIYAVILQATGILGAIAFIMIVGNLIFKFGLGVLKSRPGSARDLASIGLSTLVTGLAAGVSSQSILFEPVHAFVFWSLMAVCYCTVVCLPA
jgi:hypothetical protein